MGLYDSKKFEMQNSIPLSMSVLLQAPENFRLKNCRTFKRGLHTKSQIPNPKSQMKTEKIKMLTEKLSKCGNIWE